jgi:alkaline phosphatase
MLGLFSVSHVPFAIDRAQSAEMSRAVPTLLEMTESALRTLEQSKDGFLLQVEGARIDHAAHTNDAAALQWETGV